MVVTYDASVTGQLRQWIRDTIARSSFPFDRLPATVNFIIVAEPPCEGHKDIMCTTDNGDGTFDVHIRNGIDDPHGRVAQGLPRPARDIKSFVQESVMHELGHVIAFTALTTDAAKGEVAAFFEREGAMGDGRPVGSLEDWSDILLPWEDRITESVAEVIKDATLDSRHRIYDNRTNWELLRAHWTEFFTAIASAVGFEDHFPGAALDAAYSTVLDGTAPEVTVAGGYVRLADVGGGEGESQVHLGRVDVIPAGRTVLEVEIEWPAVISVGHEPGYNAAITIRDDSSGASSGGIPFIADATLAVQAATPGHGGNTFSLFLTTVDGEDFHSNNFSSDPLPAFDAPVWLTLEERDDGQTYAGLWSVEPPLWGGEADLAWISTASAVDVGDRYLGVWLHTQSGEIRSNLLRTMGGEPTIPDWPYEDPTASGYQGATGVMRFG